MHGPDGCDYQNKAVYVEITEPERLVYDPVSEPQFRMAMTFTDQGGKTIITTQMPLRFGRAPRQDGQGVRRR
jgi:uncharacterized protein YndB with AHSA1/START domain